MEQNNNFNFFVPLEFEKGSSPSKSMKIKGICSSASEDSDGETLYPAGFNVSPLLATGFLNYNHQASKSAAAIIGEPTKAEIINDGRDLYIEGFLYPDSDEAKAVYKLAMTLEKNSPSRRLGFSIEGKATKRDPLNQKRILAADITSVAITPCPKNPNTLLSIMKGDYQQPLVSSEEDIDEAQKSITTVTGVTGNDGGLQVESVEGGKKVIDSIINADRTVESKKLKKSEVYSEIIKAFPFAEFQKAKEIYSFIETVNQKLFNMPTTDTEVLSEALQKSFDILNQEFALVKSKDGEVAATAAPEVTPAAEVTPAPTLEKGNEVKDLDGDADDEMCSMAKKRIEKGMSADDAVADMVSKGVTLTVAQTAVAKVISEAEGLDSNGDKTNGTAVTAPVVKSEEATNDIQKAAEPVALDLSPIEDLIKSQTESFENLIKGQSDQIGQRFSGIGQILKSMNEENLSLRKANDTLQETQINLVKSIEAIAGRLNTVERTPVRNNTVTTKAAIDKFAKSEDAGADVFSLSSKEDRDVLSDRLMEEFEVSKGRGRQDTVLEKAITDLDMLGGFQPQTLQALMPRLRALKINVVE